VSVHNACFERIDEGTVPVALHNGPHCCFLGIALLERPLNHDHGVEPHHMSLVRTNASMRWMLDIHKFLACRGE
jgi:hypothetical protein